ncbi:MAG TPA: glutathione S-transferase N-terminal domain-containing protein [Dongiaceae bacterium]|nr:glutathione S-transferase N-terminal domain-containing protein [Dongiaceae bacterium]
MIKLYDVDPSGSCYKIRLLLNILKIPYEKIPLESAAAARSTNQKTNHTLSSDYPVLEDEGFSLRKPLAILVYIARKYDRSNTWFPESPEAMAEVLQWLAAGDHEVFVAAGRRLVKILNYPPDQQKLQTWVAAMFRTLDDHLSDREFLALEHPTIGDIACLPYAAMAGEGGVPLKPYVNLGRWIGRMQRIPGFIPMPGMPTP